MINNASLKNEMEIVDLIRMGQRAQAERTGPNPPGGYAGVEETKGGRYPGHPPASHFGLASLDGLDMESIMILDVMTRDGYELPAVINNETLRSEALRIRALEEYMRT